MENSTRRDFLKTAAAGTAAAAIAGLHRSASAEEQKSMFHFPPLPYANNALEPYISSRTLNIHYDKHHRKFMEQVIQRTKGTSYQTATLEKIIKETYGGINMMEALHLHATLAWNHNFYWQSMKPKGGGEMPAKLKKAVTASFGSVDAFKKQFTETAMILGVGWTWLLSDQKGKLLVSHTSYHKSPLMENKIPLLNLDCWEHAYYLDYQNRKEEYVDAYLKHLANWQFAESRLPEVKETTAPAKKETKTPKKKDAKAADKKKKG
jgi:Fe-Mn family superoxide dismutase